MAWKTLYRRYIRRQMASPVYILLITALHYCRSTVLHCDFDSGTKGDTYLPCECSGQVCTLQQAPHDQFDWTVHQGSTPSSGTGPDDDHTRADGTGLYIYTNSTAEFRTLPLSLSVTPCLTFWYHMKGQHIDELRILAAYADGTSSVIWWRSGEQGGTWTSARLSLTQSITELTFRIRRIYMASEPSGDIALDDLVIRDERCSGFADTTVNTMSGTTPRETRITTTEQSATDFDIHATFVSTVDNPPSTTGPPDDPDCPDPPCTISWGLLGASLAVMLVSITINVIFCVKNRRTSSTDHHPREHHYENKGVPGAGRTGKVPRLQPEVRKPALGDVTDYEAVDVGPSSAVHISATGALYANSGEGQRSDYGNIPSEEPMSTDTSQTTEGQGHYERMKQVRELPPNPYDVMA